MSTQHTADVINLAQRHRHGAAWASRPLPREPRDWRVMLVWLGLILGDLAILLLVYFALTSQAESAESSGPRNALLKWEAVTTNTDGSAITVPVEYRVYRGPAGQQKTHVATGNGVQLLLERQPLGNQCYQLTAFAGGRESDPTGERCKVMKLEAPKNPRFVQP